MTFLGYAFGLLVTSYLVYWFFSLFRARRGTALTIAAFLLLLRLAMGLSSVAADDRITMMLAALAVAIILVAHALIGAHLERQIPSHTPGEPFAPADINEIR